jgi:hypothetical protein
VAIWELTCPAHEAYISGEGKQKVIEWRRDGAGGFRQVKISPMDSRWARTVEQIPLTPDQIEADARRNSLTRRAEQAALQSGMAAMAAAYDHQPATSELLRARQFAGKQTTACSSCYRDFLPGANYCPHCGAGVTGLAIAPAAEPAEA